MRYLLILLFCLGAGVATPAGAVSLGDTVTCAVPFGYKCKNNVTTATVGNGSEFEVDGSSATFRRFTVDFSDNMLTLTTLGNFVVANNGLHDILTFADLTHPITGITSFSATIPARRGTNITLSDFSVSNGALRFSMAGDSASSGITFKIGLLSASAVVEPVSWALMIFGFGGVGGVLRQRRRPSGAPSRP